MSAALLSIIIPIYKVEPYLRRCLESIRKQSFTNYELLLIDDGSPDDCCRICDEYARKDERIKAIHTKNNGVSHARNTGLNMAHGKYVTFVDGDDEITVPTTYYNLINFMEGHNNIDIIQYPYEKVINKKTTEYIHPDNEILLKSKKEFIENLDSVSNGILNSIVLNKIYRKHLFKTIRFPEGAVFEDTFCMIDLFDVTRNIYISNLGLYTYHIRKGSITHSIINIKKGRDNINTHLKVYLFLQKHSKHAYMLQTDKFSNLICRYSLANYTLHDIVTDPILPKLKSVMPKKICGNNFIKLKLFIFSLLGGKNYIMATLIIRRMHFYESSLYSILKKHLSNGGHKNCT